jgi:hypothetical protein
LGLRLWARDPKRRGLKLTRRQRSIEDKESYKWLDSVQAVARLREQLPGTRLVSVADREGDVYEFFAQAQTLGVDLLVRGLGSARRWPAEPRLADAGQGANAGRAALATAA